jgi:16S rRNA (cytidine1402-2'-O)-methyltransferase
MGKLYVVGTPIGNLEDLTRRAIRILGQVALIAAEDTRVTRKLLNHLNLHGPVTSCHQHNWPAKLPVILKALESGDVALVTDAGMPAISDPGSELVASVAAAGFPVEVVPGASAVTAALAASGLSGDRFLFLGFLPRGNQERRALLASNMDSPHNLVIFESPYRVGATLRNLMEALGDRDLAVCRELTKLHEEVFRGTISQAIQHFESPRGEFVLVVRGLTRTKSPVAGEATGLIAGLTSIESELARLRESGAKAREAVASVSESSGLSKKVVYKVWLRTARR